MKIITFFGFVILTGASILPNKNRSEANAFLKRDKRWGEGMKGGNLWKPMGQQA